MIVTTYGIAGKSKERYVRKDRSKEDTYVWCERNPADSRYDTAQGTCNGADLPKAIKAACEKYDGAFYACAWPCEKELAK